jgi:hypothetical protein
MELFSEAIPIFGKEANGMTGHYSSGAKDMVNFLERFGALWT